MTEPSQRAAREDPIATARRALDLAPSEADDGAEPAPTARVDPIGVARSAGVATAAPPSAPVESAPEPSAPVESAPSPSEPVESAPVERTRWRDRSRPAWVPEAIGILIALVVAAAVFLVVGLVG